ncbi:helix-turn-helix domain-containing protein [Pedobacter sp. Du54]|uniref:helix-turn-helix transcriptional regulator n=1 Tax=Pedobacter anseongensis TaxID=3133439 RepID=UPI0030AB5159
MKNEVGHVIEMFRKRSGLTQEYMALRLGFTVHTYANMEKGRVDTSTERLYAIAQIFGIRPSQIFELAEQKIKEPDESLKYIL